MSHTPNLFRISKSPVIPLAFFLAHTSSSHLVYFLVLCSISLLEFFINYEKKQDCTLLRIKDHYDVSSTSCTTVGYDFSHCIIRNSSPPVSINMLLVFFPPITSRAQRHFSKSIFLPRVSQKQSRHFLSCASKFFQPLSTVQFQKYAHIFW